MKDKLRDKYKPFYKDKNRIAWVIWALIWNNEVTKVLYYILTFLEYSALYFFTLMIAIRFEKENFNSL